MMPAWSVICICILHILICATDGRPILSGTEFRQTDNADASRIITAALLPCLVLCVIMTVLLVYILVTFIPRDKQLPKALVPPMAVGGGVRVQEVPPMAVGGVVRVQEDSKFKLFRRMSESDEGWICSLKKNGIEVWMKPPDGSTIYTMKGRVAFADVDADTVFDILQDTEYRMKWDSNVIETFSIAKVSANSDVGYYSWKCPKPLKNRDMVTLRSWQVCEDHFMIVSSSVKHKMFPPRKDFIRAVCIQAGYLVTRTGQNSCMMTYTTQLDPGGKIPKWIVKTVSQFLVTTVIQSLHKACVEYPQWKQQNRPTHKPWRNPEQNTLPYVSLSELSIQRVEYLEQVD